MSQSIREGEKRMRRFQCEDCGAGPGERCQTKTGKPRADSHMSRFDQAWRRGLLPIRSVL